MRESRTVPDALARNLTKREVFAGVILAAIFSNPEAADVRTEKAAELAIQAADALIDALNADLHDQ
jgi:hypothetical protein